MMAEISTQNLPSAGSLGFVPADPLSAYNSLQDRHLRPFFSSPFIQRHLRNIGLVNRVGRVLSEQEFRRLVQLKQQRMDAQRTLAQQMAFQSREYELSRQLELQKQLDAVLKVELYRRMRGSSVDTNGLLHVPPRSLEQSFSRSQSTPGFRLLRNFRLKRQQSVVSSDPGKRSGLSSPKSESHDVVSASPKKGDLNGKGRPNSAPQPEDENKLPLIEPGSVGRRYLMDVQRFSYLHKLDPASLKMYRNHLLRELARLRSLSQEMSELSEFDLSLTAENDRHSRYPNIPVGENSIERLEKFDFVKSYSAGSRNVRKRWNHEGFKSATRTRSTDREEPKRRSRSQSPLKTTASADSTAERERRANALHRRIYLTSGILRSRRTKPACEIFMKYCGPFFSSNATESGGEVAAARNEEIDHGLQRILITQQCAGGSCIPILQADLTAGDRFSFPSYRHIGYPFSLVISEGENIVARLSTCCESRYRARTSVGGPQGTFEWLGVKKAIPCSRCQMARGIDAPYSNCRLKRSTLQVSSMPTPTIMKQRFVFRRKKALRKRRPRVQRVARNDDDDDDMTQLEQARDKVGARKVAQRAIRPYAARPVRKGQPVVSANRAFQPHLQRAKRSAARMPGTPLVARRPVVQKQASAASHADVTPNVAIIAGGAGLLADYIAGRDAEHASARASQASAIEDDGPSLLDSDDEGKRTNSSTSASESANASSEVDQERAECNLSDEKEVATESRSEGQQDTYRKQSESSSHVENEERASSAPESGHLAEQWTTDQAKEEDKVGTTQEADEETHPSPTASTGHDEEIHEQDQPQADAKNGTVAEAAARAEEDDQSFWSEGIDNAQAETDGADVARSEQHEQPNGRLALASDDNKQVDETDTNHVSTAEEAEEAAIEAEIRAAQDEREETTASPTNAARSITPVIAQAEERTSLQRRHSQHLNESESSPSIGSSHSSRSESRSSGSSSRPETEQKLIATIANPAAADCLEDEKQVRANGEDQKADIGDHLSLESSGSSKASAGADDRKSSGGESTRSSGSSSRSSSSSSQRSGSVSRSSRSQSSASAVNSATAHSPKLSAKAAGKEDIVAEAREEPEGEEQLEEGIKPMSISQQGSPQEDSPTKPSMESRRSSRKSSKSGSFDGYSAEKSSSSSSSASPVHEVVPVIVHAPTAEVKEDIAGQQLNEHMPRSPEISTDAENHSQPENNDRKEQQHEEPAVLSGSGTVSPQPSKSVSSLSRKESGHSDEDISSSRKSSSLVKMQSGLTTQTLKLPDGNEFEIRVNAATPQVSQHGTENSSETASNNPSPGPGAEESSAFSSDSAESTPRSSAVGEKEEKERQEEHDHERKDEHEEEEPEGEREQDEEESQQQEVSQLSESSHTPDGATKGGDHLEAERHIDEDENLEGNHQEVSRGQHSPTRTDGIPDEADISAEQSASTSPLTAAAEKELTGENASELLDIGEKAIHGASDVEAPTGVLAQASEEQMSDGHNEIRSLEPTDPDDDAGKYASEILEVQHEDVTSESSAQPADVFEDQNAERPEEEDANNFEESNVHAIEDENRGSHFNDEVADGEQNEFPEQLLDSRETYEDGSNDASAHQYIEEDHMNQDETRGTDNEIAPYSNLDQNPNANSAMSMRHWETAEENVDAEHDSADQPYVEHNAAESSHEMVNEGEATEELRAQSEQKSESRSQRSGSAKSYNVERIRDDDLASFYNKIGNENEAEDLGRDGALPQNKIETEDHSVTQAANIDEAEASYFDKFAQGEHQSEADGYNSDVYEASRSSVADANQAAVDQGEAPLLEGIAEEGYRDESPALPLEADSAQPDASENAAEQREYEAPAGAEDEHDDNAQEAVAAEEHYASEAGSSTMEANEWNFTDKLQNFQHAEDIAITNRDLSLEEVQSIGSLLAGQSNIRSINLRSVGLDDHGLEVLASAMENNSSPLKTLSLNSNRITADGVPQILRILENKPVTILQLSENSLGDVGAQILFQYLDETAENSLLTRIDIGDHNGQNSLIGDNNLADEAAGIIGRYLSRNPPVQKLSLSGNDFSSVGWQMLSDGLLPNTNIHVLSCDYCNMGDEGFAELCQALSRMPNLQSLDLEGNELSEQSAALLVEFARQAPKLTNVCLTAGNNISTATINRIKQIISGKQPNAADNKDQLAV